MNLSLFQRLTLLGIAELIWMVGNRAHYGKLAEMMRTMAFGQHNPAQQEAMFEEYKRSRAK
jgi:hypothetical protein